MLTINITEKRYNSKIILKNISLTIEETGIYGVVGKNGAGKTTFFNCISQLTDYQGVITFQKEAISAEKVAFLPTEPFVYEHLSVSEFYAFFRKLTQTKPKQPSFFDIDASLLISELSTGMRKKVYFNAVLQKEYEIYIFDEPFNGLDIESVYFIRQIIQNLAKNHIIFVSSHILETLNECKKVFLIENSHIHTFFPNEMDKIKSFFSF